MTRRTLLVAAGLVGAGLMLPPALLAAEEKVTLTVTGMT